MKKIILPLLVFFSILFISCKSLELNLEANVEMSAEFISKFLNEHDTPLDNNGDESMFPFYGIEYEEAKEIVRSLGGTKGFVTSNFATEFGGLSLKKVYVKKGVVAQGWFSFENPMPHRLLEVLDKFLEDQKDSLEMNISYDKKYISYNYAFKEDMFVFDSSAEGSEELDFSKVKDSKPAKNFSVKIRGGKIIVELAKKIEGVSAQIILSRIKNVTPSSN